MSLRSSRSQKSPYHLVQGKFAIQLLNVLRANVNATAFSKLHPTSTSEFAIRSTDGIRVDVVAAREIASTGKTLFSFQIVADNPQNNLSHQLLPDRNLTVFGEPESHRFEIDDLRFQIDPLESVMVCSIGPIGSIGPINLKS